jgi:hypothetical protein
MSRLRIVGVLLAASGFVLSGCSNPSSEDTAPGRSDNPAPGSQTTDSRSASSQAPRTGAGSAMAGISAPGSITVSASSSSSAGVVAPTASSTGSGDGHPGGGQPVDFTRPSLVGHTGQYFTWMMPADWKSNETANGVDMTSADGSIIASSALLVGTPGQTDPWSFVCNLLTHLGARSLQRNSARNLPPQRSGYPGIDWQIQDFEVSFTDSAGSARRAELTCGICNAYGAYSALLQSFSTPANDYDLGRTWLPLLPPSVKAIDPSRIAYQNDLLPVQNHPLDNSALMESWKEKRLSQDRIARAQHETTMGYERMVSPSTGQYYNMPFESYDSVRGGYHNPDHPDEMLNKTQPGE